MNLKEVGCKGKTCRKVRDAFKSRPKGKSVFAHRGEVVNKLEQTTAEDFGKQRGKRGCRQKRN